jgi:hypothetical protein
LRASVGSVRPRFAILVAALAAWGGVPRGARAQDDTPAPAPKPSEVAPPASPAPETPVSGFRFATDPRVRRDIDLERLRNGGDRADPRDFIPAIRKPLAVPRVEATHVRDEDPVVGVEIDGEARAYPIAQLDAHEIVNDVLGGVEIAVTYCPLCDAAVVYRRRLPEGKGVPDEPLVFGCSGWLHDSDVLIYDAQTETFWQQITGRAVVGPLTGARLPQVPLVRASLSDWQAAHPKTTVLSWRTEHAYPQALYRRNAYAGYRVSKQIQFPVGARDERLPLKASVFGMRIAETDVAVPDAALEGRKEPLTFALGDAEARVHAAAPAGEPRAEVRTKDATGAFGPWTRAQGLRCYWFAWFAFHPTTRVVAADGSVGPAAAPAKEPAK